MLSARMGAEALESGRWDGVIARALASAWAPIAARGLVRPATVPTGIAVVCVGGATLGGSGKTRIAIACAAELARAGARVALVGHAYRSARRVARVVSSALCDPRSAEPIVEEVGDEAIVCANALAGSGAHVVVGPTRQSAIDHATTLAPDVIVLDGPLRIAERGTRCLSLLAVDSDRPWGSGRLPPAGDLRAEPEVLLACADHVVPVDAMPTSMRWEGHRGSRSVESLRGMRLGLFTAIARPDRLIEKLGVLGVALAETVSVPDHGPIPPTARAWLSDVRRRSTRRVDAWIATEKCALHLRPVLRDEPLGVLESSPRLSAPVQRELRALSRERAPWSERRSPP